MAGKAKNTPSSAEGKKTNRKSSVKKTTPVAVEPEMEEISEEEETAVPSEMEREEAPEEIPAEFVEEEEDGEEGTVQADTPVNERLRKMMDTNFIEYASYVIKDRAIPDVDDGLKPVQRRILWTLHQIDNGSYQIRLAIMYEP